MKKLKKFSLLILLCMLFSVIVMPASANAAPKLNKKSAQIYIGKTTKLKVLGKKGKIKWRSSKPSVASVSSSGVVKGKAAGKTTITAKAGSKKLKCTIKVKRALVVKQKSITINGVGKSAKINVNFLPDDGTVTYRIADTSIVSGKWGRPTGFPDHITVYGKKAGTTSIKIYNDFNKEVYVVTVYVKGAGNSITPSAPSTTKPAFDTLAEEIKNIGFYTEGTYAIVNELRTNTNMIVQYDESNGTICFTLMYQSGSSNSITQMTIYKNSDKCYLYLTVSDGKTAYDFEKTVTRSQIHYQGYISFEFTDATRTLMNLIGIKQPTASQLSNTNGLFNIFLKGCNLTIPGTYYGHTVTVKMKDLFPNF